MSFSTKPNIVGCHEENFGDSKRERNDTSSFK